MYKWLVYITLYKWFVCLMSRKLFDVLWSLILLSSDHYNKQDLYLIWYSFSLSKPNAGAFISVIFYINGTFINLKLIYQFHNISISLIKHYISKLWNISNKHTITTTFTCKFITWKTKTLQRKWYFNWSLDDPLWTQYFDPFFVANINIVYVMCIH